MWRNTQVAKGAVPHHFGCGMKLRSCTLDVFGAVPKRLREKSAKLRFVGSIPTRAFILVEICIKKNLSVTWRYFDGCVAQLVRVLA